MRSISRRSVLRGMAGAAALAALPDLTSALPAAAATTPGQKGLIGATVFSNAYPGLGSRLANGEMFDDFVGRPLCLKVQRVYFMESQWPTDVDHPQPVGSLTGAGIKLIISFHPYHDVTNTTLAEADLDSLKKAIQLFQTIPNIDFEVALWHEANDDLGLFPTAAAYHRFVAYYAPAVRAAGVPLLYIPFMAGAAADRALTYYPGPSLADRILVDFYGNAWKNGVRLDQIMALADGTSGPVPVASAPKPFGISEWGDSADPGSQLGPADFHAYVTYIVDLMTGRLAAGKTNADIVYYDGGGPNDNITSPTDFKVPELQRVFDALNR